MVRFRTRRPHALEQPVAIVTSCLVLQQVSHDTLGRVEERQLAEPIFRQNVYKSGHLPRLANGRQMLIIEQSWRDAIGFQIGVGRLFKITRFLV